MSYHELSATERVTIQIGLCNGFSQRRLARLMNRSPSTVSREIRRNRNAQGEYVADDAQRLMHTRRVVCRPAKRLVPGNELFELVAHLLRQRFSPEQIAGKLRTMKSPSFEDAYVCRETIYNAIYALPVGELRKELIICLRQGKTTRRPRSGGVDRRGQIPDMVSIHVRPPEIEDRLMPGHWEGDLIKGAGNRSAVGTLVERKSRYLLMTKLRDCSAEATLEAFTRKFRHVPPCVRKTLTYDQGKEMARHELLAKRLKINVYFADPHSPWQRPTNENTNGLIREYLPKGLDLAPISQGYLNAIARQLNDRPRKCLGFETPAEVFAREIMSLQPSVALQT